MGLIHFVSHFSERKKFQLRNLFLLYIYPWQSHPSLKLFYWVKVRIHNFFNVLHVKSLFRFFIVAKSALSLRGAFTDLFDIQVV